LKRTKLLIFSCALALGLVIAVSAASAEVSAPEPPTAESSAPAVDHVLITSPPGVVAVVAADGSVTYRESTPSPEASAVPAATASPAALCSANVICVYLNANYGTLKAEVNCNFAGLAEFTSNAHSALNRCGNKTNYLRASGTVIACMDPGGERPNPGAYNQVYVLANYGAFC
jgi:hypothetical protein